MLFGVAVVLHLHPDKRFADYILEGIHQGFHISYAHSSFHCTLVKRNMKSASQFPQVISDYLATECSSERTVKLNRPSPYPVHISPFGVIPKRHKWGLIVDLSSPKGHSVNDGIVLSICSLQYTSLDQAVDMIRSLGQEALRAKIDIQNVYRILPIHLDDRRLLGLSWRGHIYVDTTLPFEL